MNRPATPRREAVAFAAEDTDALLRVMNRNAAAILVRELMRNLPLAQRNAIFTAALDAAAGQVHKSKWEKSSEQEAFDLVLLLLKP